MCMQGPTKSKELLGRWKLLYTSTPGTESPIQRTFTGIDSFQVFQDVVQDEKTLRVRNVIRFGREVGLICTCRLVCSNLRSIDACAVGCLARLGPLESRQKPTPMNSLLQDLSPDRPQGFPSLARVQPNHLTPK